MKPPLMREQRSKPRGEMPFLDHLEELRWRIFKAVGSLMVGAAIGFWVVFRYDVVGLLRAPIEPYLTDGQLVFSAPTDAFFFGIKISLILGAVAAFPVILYQIWAFLSPALEKREKQLIVPALYGGLVLFAVGVWLGYDIALPISLEFLLGFFEDEFTPLITINAHLSFTVRLLLAFGLIFELPVVILILSAMGLVTPAFLRSKRRHAIVIITILASLLSPGDVLAVTVILMGPLVVLYEASIWISVFVYRWKGQDPEPTIHRPGEPPASSVSLHDDEEDQQ